MDDRMRRLQQAGVRTPDVGWRMIAARSRLLVADVEAPRIRCLASGPCHVWRTSKGGLDARIAVPDGGPVAVAVLEDLAARCAGGSAARRGRVPPP